MDTIKELIDYAKRKPSEALLATATGMIGGALIGYALYIAIISIIPEDQKEIEAA